MIALPWATGSANGKAKALAREAKAGRAERAGRGRRRLSQILVFVGLSDRYLMVPQNPMMDDDGI